MKKGRVTPYMTISLTFIGVIVIGAILLLLPISTKEGYQLSFIDALFMSTTSTCVTGLSVVSDIGTEFTIFGKIVICILVELGGLSFLTIAVFCFILLGVKIGVAERFLLKESLNQTSATGLIKLVKNIVLLSLGIQFVGGLFNFLILLRYFDPLKALGVGFFHTISSFNNAGLDIFGNANSMISYSNDILLNISTMLLIILGGIGFIVMTDVVSKKRFKKFSIHTKIVLVTTFILIVGGTILIKLAMPSDMTWLQAAFQSVTCRTAGFCTYDLSSINNACYIIMVFLMIVGASPCSTGGGMKTTTIAVIFVSIFSYARGKTPKICNRKIAAQSIIKAFSLFAICVLVLTLSVYLISVFETNKDITIVQIVFEAVSAISTTGLSMGITMQLGVVSKVILICLMLFGRLGPLSVLSMWNVNWMREDNERIRYVEERIIIG